MILKVNQTFSSRKAERNVSLKPMKKAYYALDYSCAL